MTEIPIIDFAPLRSGSPDAVAALGRQVDAACRDTGFFCMANPPLPPGLIDRVYAMAEAFFALPEAEKMRHYIGDQPNHRGYVPPGEEQYGAVQGDSTAETATPKELKEGFEVGIDTGADDPDLARGGLFLGPNTWPGRPEGFRETCETYYAEMTSLARLLLGIFATSLGEPVETFSAMTRKPASNLRLLRYHARDVAPDELALGIGVHTDSEIFTLLATRGAGLQAVSRDGRWVDVPEVPGGLVVNIGDTMEAWTGGTYVSTQHRVVSDGAERYSLPFFFAADFFQEIRPLPRFDTASDPERYPPFVSGLHIVSEYAKGFAYMKALARAGKLELETAFDESSNFAKTPKD